ncbi:MAG: amino acid ABC transporter permease [Lachnospiraceae bacterium]|nr:amino acid ABC transporter permease [Lachnospiraceae bacterium]
MTLNYEFMLETFVESLKGIPVTLLITAISLLAALPLGFIMALVRDGNKHKIAKAILDVYASFVRGVPMIVQIMLMYVLFPDILSLIAKALHLPIDIYGVPNIAYAILLFVLWTTSFLSETFRAGLHTVNKGQLEAAVSNGMTTFQGYTRIVIPQVLTNMLPVLCTNTNTLIKMTSLCFAMSVIEITAIAKIAAGNNLCYVEAYLVTALIYIIICFTVENIFKFMERNVSKKYKRLAAG